MDPLETKLKRALELKEPPAGFADRVVARALEEAAAARQRRAQAGPDRSPFGWFGWLFASGWRTALAGGLAGLLLLGSGLAYRRHEERVRGEKAAAEVILALEIASSKLNRVRYVLAPEDRQSRGTRGKGSYESQN